jgi:thiol-disulfide isomerase/thioredoxin
MKTRTLGIVIVVAVVAVAAVIALSARDSSSSGGTATGGGPYDGEIIAPDAFKVADYAGGPVVLNFFFRDCPPCGAEAADLAEFARSNTDAQVIGVDVQDSESDAVDFMEEHGLDYPLVVDDGTLSSRYAVQYTPTTVFLDAEGEEVDRLVGASTLDQFNASLAKAQ